MASPSKGRAFSGWISSTIPRMRAFRGWVGMRHTPRGFLFPLVASLQRYMYSIEVPQGMLIKQGDNAPSIRAKVYDCLGLPLDLTDCDVSFWMRERGSPVRVVSGLPAIVSGDKGCVEYRWGESDTLRSGDYEAEFVIVLSDGHRFTVPVDGYLAVSIADDVEYNQFD